jgi:tRNA-dihydrouridine synthase
MTRAVKIPVTVKMRKGWDDGEVNAGELARRVEDAGAKAIAIHGRTAKQSYGGSADWDFVTEVAKTVSIPVFGSGDCIEPEDIIARMRSGVSGVYVGRGVLRNPWILAQARDLMEGKPPDRSRTKSAASSCSTTCSCCSAKVRAEVRHPQPRGRKPLISASGGERGSSTRFAPCAAGTPRASKAEHSSASA